MRDHSTATNSNAIPLSPAGLGWGFLGVLAFSFTVPLTRVATQGMDAYFIGSARAVVAALCAGTLLLIVRAPRPHGRQWVSLAVVACGVVAGFPLLTSVALESVSAGHAAVVMGMLPAATAVCAVIRSGERPSPVFWVAAAAGTLAVAVFVSLRTGGVELGASALDDVRLIGGVVAAAIGYTEGARLSKQLGSWQTICWALVVAFPAMALLTALRPWPSVDTTGAQWASLLYLSLVSMFLGFFAWYRGLAIGPVAGVSQIQLVQPVLSIAWAAALLREPLTLPLILGALAVIVCAAVAVTARVQAVPPPEPRTVRPRRLHAADSA
ncbi:MAG: DMT family transporter [Rhodococcus sp.]|nr:DMT family transporter [Rhodococcus sp. (in: high G+C Gram-positive bacteria)]